MFSILRTPENGYIVPIHTCVLMCIVSNQDLLIWSYVRMYVRTYTVMNLYIQLQYYNLHPCYICAYVTFEVRTYVIQH